jgi:hypothetical protein
MDYNILFLGGSSAYLLGAGSSLMFLLAWLLARNTSELDAPLLTSDSGDFLQIMRKGYAEVSILCFGSLVKLDLLYRLC